MSKSAGRHVGCLARVKMIPSPTVVIHNSTAVHDKKRIMTLKNVAPTLAHLLNTLSWRRVMRVCKDITRSDVPAAVMQITSVKNKDLSTLERAKREIWTERVNRLDQSRS